jgi:hypothetical protein
MRPIKLGAVRNRSVGSNAKATYGLDADRLEMIQAYGSVGGNLSVDFPGADPSPSR